MHPVRHPATSSHVYSNSPATSVSTSQPSDAGTVYAQIAPGLPEQVISDPTLMRYQNETSHVFPQQLLRIPDRFGLPEIAELKQLRMTQASVANATVLPPDGMGGSSMVLGDPGRDLAKAGTKERVARFGAALLTQSVDHIVCTNHSDSLAKVHLPIGQKLELAGQGGPLEMSFVQSSGDDAGVARLRVEAKLPSGHTEHSGDIGIWTINLGTDSVAHIQNTLKLLYQQSDGQNVAFCCQSGNSRSGAAAVLFHQRKTAEDMLMRNEVPKVSELVNAATSWGTECKAARGSAFAGKIRADLLEQHAQGLVDEMTARSSASRPKEGPATRPKPVQTVKPELKAKGQPDAVPHAPPAKPGTTSKMDSAPQPAPKPFPRTARKSDDTVSVASGISNVSAFSDDTVSLDSQGRTYERLKHGGQSDASSLASYNHGQPGTPADVAGSPGNHSLQRSPRHSPQQSPQNSPVAPRANTMESASFNVKDDVALYSKPWESQPIRAFSPNMRAHEDRNARFRQSFRQTTSLLKYITSQPSSGTRSTEDPYSVATDSRDAPGALHVSLNAWQNGSHAQTRNLQSYLRVVAQGFTQEATKGLNPFAAKTSFGVGRAIESVKKESGNALWNDLSEALETTMSEAEERQSLMTTLVLTSVMREQLDREYKSMDHKLQDTWRRRTGREYLATAMKNVGDQLQKLHNDMDSNQASGNELVQQLRSLNLTMLSLKALYEVGHDPALKP